MQFSYEVVCRASGKNTEFPSAISNSFVLGPEQERVDKFERMRIFFTFTQGGLNQWLLEITEVANNFGQCRINIVADGADATAPRLVEQNIL